MICIVSLPCTILRVGSSARWRVRATVENGHWTGVGPHLSAQSAVLMEILGIIKIFIRLKY